MSLTSVSERSLESWLWDAANILRGPVDASDFKAYVFPLLFLKRISDVYDEERATALEESGGDEEYASLPEQHRFQIPEGCRSPVPPMRPHQGSASSSAAQDA